MRRQGGFTLIELVVVIVILGILAAFALPKFVGLQVEARNATLRGLKGSLHGAASLAHAKALATGSSANQTISVEGSNVEMVYHYPNATSQGIGNMLQDLSGFTNSSPSGGGVDIRFYPSGKNGVADCSVTYYRPAQSGNGPTITIDTSNCD